MASQVPSAAFGGAISGAAAGTSVLPGWGTAIGAGVGLLSGIFQGSRANKLQSQYDKAEAALQPVRPEEYAYLNRVRQQERAYRTATDPSSAFALGQTRGVGSQTQTNLLRAGGPGAIGNILRAQAGTNQAVGAIGANAARQADSLMGMQGSLITNMSQRLYERQRELRNQAMERSVSAQQNIQNMFSGALAMLPSMTGGFGKTNPAGPSSQTMTNQLAQYSSGLSAPMSVPGQAPIAPMTGPAYSPGGMIGSTYVPGVNTGINYGGLGTGFQTPPINYGLR